MFNFIGMIGNHKDRMVDQYDENGLFIDTAYVNDGEHPYETAVEHEKYNNGKMVIVEAYDTKEEAQIGHDKWVKTMTSGTLPKTLVDCRNSFISQLASEVGCDTEFEIE
jgi:hypothetical protein